MIIWGGTIKKPDQSKPEVNTGGIYYPENDSWVATSIIGDCLSPRSGHVAFWTGNSMLVWGGDNGSFYINGEAYVDGALYYSESNSWSRITPATGYLSQRFGFSAVWTGQKMIIWGGQFYDNVTLRYEYTNTGAIYDFETDTWSTISNGAGCPSPRFSHLAVWTGNEMIVWGGYGNNCLLDTGAKYNPDTDSWLPISSSGTIGQRGATSLSRAVWTGSKIIITYSSNTMFPMGTASIYNPEGNYWYISATLLLARYPFGGHTAIWTGNDMIAWGGGNHREGNRNRGFIYYPDTNKWDYTAIDADCPSTRRFHTAVWTGTSMIIWGGDEEVVWDDIKPLNTGGIFTP
jgi:hypothetical protein